MYFKKRIRFVLEGKTSLVDNANFIIQARVIRGQFQYRVVGMLAERRNDAANKVYT